MNVCNASKCSGLSHIVADSHQGILSVQTDFDGMLGGVGADRITLNARAQCLVRLSSEPPQLSALFGQQREGFQRHSLSNLDLFKQSSLQTMLQTF